MSRRNVFLTATLVLAAWPLKSIAAPQGPALVDTSEHAEEHVSFRKPRMPITVNNVPLPVVVLNQSLPVTVRNTSLGGQILNVPLPTRIVNPRVPVEVRGLPLPTVLVNNSLPVSVVNETLNFNVLNNPLSVSVAQPLRMEILNRPLQTSFDRPVSTESEQLGTYLTQMAEGIAGLQNLLLKQFQRPVCPTDSSFGTNSTAPCRRIDTQCYCFFNGIKHTYYEANDFCTLAGFDGLVSLETMVEAMALADLLKLLDTSSGTTYFTSGVAGDQNTWHTDKTESPIFYSEALWDAGEPAPGLTNPCITVYYPDGHWRLQECDTVQNFICEVGIPSNAIDPSIPPNSP